MTATATRPTLLVLASTYPRWPDDHEPGFVHELNKRLAKHFRVIALVPDAPNAQPSGMLDDVEVHRYRYAPRALQTLVNNGGIAVNLQRARWKWLLLPGFIVGQYLAARRIARHQAIDVVHAHWLIPQGLVARTLKRRLGIPYVVTSHGGDLFGVRGALPELLKRRVAASSSAMTVVSSAMREEVARIGLCPPRLEVLPMGADLGVRFVPDPASERVGNELLFVGRLVAKKGLRHLIDAMPAVLAQRPDVVLTIAGFGPEEPALRTQASALRVLDSIRFLGAVPQAELPALYRRASLFVAPFIRDPSGNQEGLPVALMEATGCGCPVVVGDVAGVRDLLGDAADAVCIQPENTKAFADAILAALADPQAAGARAAAIRAHSGAKVNWGRVADAYAKVITEAMDDAGPQGAGAGSTP